MWRKIGAALIAAAVLATPVLAIETVPAKIHSAGKAKMKAKTAGKIVTGNIGKPKVAKNHIAKNRIAKNRIAKGSIATGAIAKGHVAKSKTPPAKLAAGISSKPGNKKAKAGTNGRHLAAAKPPRQRVSVLPAKSRHQVKAAEPVETTGSVAPRSVSTPRLY